LLISQKIHFFDRLFSFIFSNYPLFEAKFTSWQAFFSGFLNIYEVHMSKEAIIVEGKVLCEHKGDVYEIELGNGVKVRAKRSGRMNKNRIKVLAGDRVLVELCPYELTKGRITRRL
jgi:translation initiation factor IF-1